MLFANKLVNFLLYITNMGNLKSENTVVSFILFKILFFPSKNKYLLLNIVYKYTVLTNQKYVFHFQSHSEPF